MPKRKLAREPLDESLDVPAAKGSAKISKRRRVAEEIVEDSVTHSLEQDHDVPDDNSEISSKAVRKGRRRVSPKANAKKQTTRNEEVYVQPVEYNSKRKRRTKDEKQSEAMPLAARTIAHKLYIGAHVSAAGGANAFALFLKSQRKWANPPLADEHWSSFCDNCKSHSYDPAQHVVPHGSYLVNLAHTDQERTDQAFDSYLDDIKRCEKLGIKLYNIHPGNTVKNDRQEAIAHLAKNINRAHQQTSNVVTLLENMAAGGNVLGSTFEDLRDIIALVTDKQRIGVCIDTCHAFAGGYDLRTPTAFKATMDHFEETVGMQYLRALHINDSKAPFSSHRDLHANIGTGFLGLRAFHNIVNEARFEGLPLILETPIEVRDEDGTAVKDDKGKPKEDKGIWAREIKMLESLVGMDTESEEFAKLEKQLARQGEPERKRLADQMDRKREKEEQKRDKTKGRAVAATKGKKGSENSAVANDNDDSSELSELEDDAA